MRLLHHQKLATRCKRMVKKQSMQWTHEGAHYMMQTRTAVLNNELQGHFVRWYPGFKIEESAVAAAEVAQNCA